MLLGMLETSYMFIFPILAIALALILAAKTELASIYIGGIVAVVFLLAFWGLLALSVSRMTIPIQGSFMCFGAEFILGFLTAILARKYQR